MRLLRSCVPLRHVTLQWRRWESSKKQVRSSKWKGTKKLPFLNHTELLEMLNDHVQETPCKKVLLLWGAKSVGKSSSIQLKEDEWRKNGHLIVDVDLKGFEGTYEHFLEIFDEAMNSALQQNGVVIEKSIEKALMQDRRHRLKKENEQAKREAASRLTKLISRAKESTWWNVFSFFYGGWMSPKTVVEGVTIISPVLENFKDQMNTYIGGKQARDIKYMFMLLESVAANAPRPPIVVFRELEALDNLSDEPLLGRETVQRLFEYFEQRKQSNSKVPVIIETADFMWSRARQISDSRESFKQYFVPFFTREYLEEVLVNSKHPELQYQIFTQEEFDDVWDHCGGHPGTLYSLHDSLTAGQSLAGVLEEQQHQFFSTLRAIVVNVTDEHTKRNNDAALKEQIILERKQVLKRLIRNNYKMFVENPDADVALKYLLDNNILFYDGEFVTPQNRPMQNAILKYSTFFN